MNLDGGLAVRSQIKELFAYFIMAFFSTTCAGFEPLPAGVISVGFVVDPEDQRRLLTPPSERAPFLIRELEAMSADAGTWDPARSGDIFLLVRYENLAQSGGTKLWPVQVEAMDPTGKVSYRLRHTLPHGGPFRTTFSTIRLKAIEMARLPGPWSIRVKFPHGPPVLRLIRIPLRGHPSLVSPPASVAGHRATDIPRSSRELDRLMWSGELAEARGGYEKLVREAEREQDDRKRAYALRGLSFAQYRLSDYSAALETNTRSLELHQKMGLNAGIVLGIRGHILAALGRFDEAHESYVRSLRERKKIGSNRTIMIGLQNLGVSFLRRGDLKRAMSLFQEGLRIAENLREPYWTAAMLRDIAQVHERAGEFGEAIPFVERATQIHHDLGFQERLAYSRLVLGRIYRKGRAFQKSLDALEGSIHVAGVVGAGDLSGLAWFEVGQVYLEMGMQQEALHAFEKAMDSREAVRGGLTRPSDREGYFSTALGPYESALRVASLLGGASKSFEIAERARGRTLLDLMASRRLALKDPFRGRVYMELVKLQGSISRPEAEEAAPSGPKGAKMRGAPAHAEAERALNELLKADPSGANLFTGRVLTAEEVQKRLGGEQALVAFYVPEKADQPVYRWTIDKRGVRLQVLSAQLAGDLVGYVGQLRRSMKEADSKARLLGELLKRSLFDKFALDSTTRHLIVIPHGVLHYLPFPALHDGEKYFGERYAITQLPSASLVQYLVNAAPPNQGHLVALGNPKAKGLPSLPAADREVYGIAKLFPSKIVFTGEKATEPALLAYSPDATALHIASHAVIDVKNPMASFLALTPGGKSESDRPEDRDGLLQLNEIFGLPLKRNPLVVLSACETALSTVSKGDELIGLTRGFLYAGASAVLASLWKVDDDATALLMEKFYGSLAKGTPKAVALQQAQAAVRATKGFEHPFYWAAWTLTGDWR